MSAAFLLHAGLRKQFDAARSRLEGHARPDALLDEAQLRALQRTWQDATKDVPYYRDLVASGQAPETLDSWRDVDALPILTRRLLQEQPERFIRLSGAPDGLMTTAGSTGTPLKMGMNQAERDLMRVVKLSTWQSFGYQPSSRLFLIWGHAHLLGTGWKGRVNHAKRRLADAALGYRRVDAYRLTADACARHAETLLAFRPIGIIGYASALDLFARYTPQYRDRFQRLGLRFVLTTAEAPPREDSTPLLEQHFGCTVVQEYGGAEFGQVAFKAGDQPFETYGDLNYVETRMSEQQEQAVLITSLYPRYVPLVRYQVGDTIIGAQRSPNGHVASFVTIAGRLNDVIMLGEGDAVHSVAVFHCVHQERVYNLQMILNDDGVDLCLVSPETDRLPMEARIRARLAQVHPLLANVRFKYLDDLETNRAGKRRWFVDRRTETRMMADGR